MYLITTSHHWSSSAIINSSSAITRSNQGILNPLPSSRATNRTDPLKDVILEHDQLQDRLAKALHNHTPTACLGTDDGTMCTDETGDVWSMALAFCPSGRQISTHGQPWSTHINPYEPWSNHANSDGFHPGHHGQQSCRMMIPRVHESMAEFTSVVAHVAGWWWRWRWCWWWWWWWVSQPLQTFQSQ